MADILKFRVRKMAKASPAPARRGKPAEIVIFPGVRYERWQAEPSQPGSRKKVKRDMLTIGE